MSSKKNPFKDRHLINLKTLFALTGNGQSIDIKKVKTILYQLERQANKAAIDYCNGVIDIDGFNQIAFTIKTKVMTLFPNLKGFFVNSDGRGYALKINSSILYKEGYKIHTDMGGDGILAPDFT